MLNFFMPYPLIEFCRCAYLFLLKKQSKTPKVNGAGWLFLVIFLLTLGLPIAGHTADPDNTDHSRQKAGQVLFSQEPYLDLHTGPGRGYPIFHIIEAGDSFQVLYHFTQWYKVVTESGHEGWLSANSINKTLITENRPFHTTSFDGDQYLEREWELGVLSGEFGSASTISGYGTYHFTENIASEITLMQSLGSASSSQLLLVSLYQQPFPKWRYAPFFGLGTGIVKTDPKTSLVDSEDRTNQIMHATLGIRRYFTQQFLLRAEYNHYVAFTDIDNNQELNGWKLGLSVFLK